MALSNQAPGFSPLLKNNSIVAFGERLLSEVCHEIAQQNPTIHPSLSTRLPGHYEWVDSTAPKIKSRAFLAQISKGKVKSMCDKLLACCPVHRSMSCNLILSEDGRSINPKAILFPDFIVIQANLNDFAPLESEAIHQCCPQRNDTQILIYDFSFLRLGQASNTSHQDWLKDPIIFFSVLQSIPHTTAWCGQVLTSHWVHGIVPATYKCTIGCRDTREVEDLSAMKPLWLPLANQNIYNLLILPFAILREQAFLSPSSLPPLSLHSSHPGG